MTPARTPAARARADARSRNGKFTVTLKTALGSAVLHPLPVGQWRDSARYAMLEGDTRGWASKVLPPKEYDKWVELDPNGEEMIAFFSQFNEQSGEDPGESPAS